MEKEITHRPADDIPAEYSKLEEECKVLLGTSSVTVEDVLTLAMFPKVAPNFFKTRADGPVVFKPEDAAPAAAKVAGQAESYNVNVNGLNYAVVVSPAGTVAAVPAAVATGGGVPAAAPSGGAPVAAPAPAAGGTGGVVIPAPVAGTILRYVAAEGAQVASGATILILESMKMELEIKAPAAGRVHFLQPTGAQVAAQQPIAEIGGVAGAAPAAPAPVAAPAPAAPAPAAMPSGGGTVVPAPVAGTVLRYAAAEGAQVASGATVLILESMKMELEIKAPAAGKVHFLVPTGAQVASQQPIVEIG
jgi:oxaloacetate decarboxylase alpha subunit